MFWEEWRAVPEEAQKKIPGGKLKGKTDINPMWRYKVLTEKFGPYGLGWWYEIDEIRIIQTEDEQMVHVEISFYYKFNGETSQKLKGVGGNKVVQKFNNYTEANDEGVKMALTDAISVVCKQLGIGADIYWREENSKYTKEKPADPITEEDRKIMEQLKIDINNLATFLKKSPEQVTHTDIVGAVKKKKEILQKSVDFIGKQEIKDVTI